LFGKKVNIGRDNNGYNVMGNHNKIKIIDIHLPNINNKCLTPCTSNDALSHNIIGRKKEIKEIKDKLIKHNILLIHGIPQIGKSKIASHIFNKIKDNYDYYGYIVIKKNIKSDFIYNFNYFFNLELENISFNKDIYNSYFYSILTALNNLKGQGLLFIDFEIKNFKLEEIKDILYLANNGFKILLISQNKLYGIETYYIEELSLNDAKIFFKKNNIDSTNLIKLLKCIDRLPPYLEIIQEIIHNKDYELEFLINECEKGKIFQLKIIDIYDMGKSFILNEILNKVPFFDELEKNYILILKRLSNIKENKYLKFEELKPLLPTNIMESHLKFLVNKGWLIESNSSYKIPQVTKNYISEHFNIVDKKYKNLNRESLINTKSKPNVLLRKA
jgi:sulfur relay (sulfurtransferase) DsrF/TusC family protein